MDDILLSDILFSDNALHPHDTKNPGLSALLTRDEYDEIAAIVDEE